MNADEIQKLFPNASPAFVRRNADEAGHADLHPNCSGPVAVVERHPEDGAVGEVQVKERACKKFFVRVTSHRRRLLDEDNLCAKYHIDLCRYAGIFPSDAPGKAKIEVCQQKVGSKEAEFTTIEIYAV